MTKQFIMTKKMKFIKIIVICVIMLFVFSECKQPNHKSDAYYVGTSIRKSEKIEEIKRFKKGDIVYLKPDSIKVVIENVSNCNCGYDVYWFDKQNHKQWMNVDDILIF